jgi:hypothetical protein
MARMDRTDGWGKAWKWRQPWQDNSVECMQQGMPPQKMQVRAEHTVSMLPRKMQDRVAGHTLSLGSARRGRRCTSRGPARIASRGLCRRAAPAPRSHPALREGMGFTGGHAEPFTRSPTKGSRREGAMGDAAHKVPCGENLPGV